jgi:ferredoxin
MMRVCIDYDKCTGLGLCESIAPEFFEVQDDGSLELLQSEADESHRSSLEEAVRACPTEAIRLEG